MRIPQQKRSIEKKEGIIDAATKIFMERGYLNTSTAEIAKAAGISTGSFYAYYQDKKDILIACLYRFGDTLTSQICEKISTISYDDDISITIRNVLLLFVNYHGWTKLLHDEIMSLQYIDKDVKDYFEYIQKAMMAAIAEHLEALGYSFKNEREQTFLIFQMILGIENELAFNSNQDIDKDILIDECTKVMMQMIIKK